MRVTRRVKDEPRQQVRHRLDKTQVVMVRHARQVEMKRGDRRNIEPLRHQHAGDANEDRMDEVRDVRIKRLQLLVGGQRRRANTEFRVQGKGHAGHADDRRVVVALDAHFRRDDDRFDADTPYDPRSPYSASKAGSDHLARAWHHTYGMPVLVTNCSNNYGPYQFPEKLVPLMILNALEGKPLPVYGKGENVRDWLHVDDHVDALLAVLGRGRTGETYLVGGHGERRNIDVVREICALVDELATPLARPRSELIEFVVDRPGHDFRYAIDPSRIETELGWRPRHTFEEGLRTTVQWYLDNPHWCERVQSGAYRRERLGLADA